MSGVEGLQDFRIVELPHLFLRHRSSKSKRAHRWDYGWSRSIFSIATAEEFEIVPAFRVRLLGRTHEIVRVRGSLYRRVLDAAGSPAWIEGLERADPEMLLDDADDPWTDHCSFVCRASTAPEEPSAKAVLGPEKVNGSVDTHQARSRIELQERLNHYLAIGDRLWAPTGPPGLMVGQASAREGAWIPGLTATISTGLHLDSSDRAWKMNRNGARGAIKRHPGFLEDGLDGSRYAMRANIGWVLQSIVSCACPTVAALGPDIAALFWTGRQCLLVGDSVRYRNWLGEAATVLVPSGLKELAQVGRMLAQEYNGSTEPEFDRPIVQGPSIDMGCS